MRLDAANHSGDSFYSTCRNRVKAFDVPGGNSDRPRDLAKTSGEKGQMKNPNQERKLQHLFLHFVPAFQADPVSCFWERKVRETVQRLTRSKCAVKAESNVPIYGLEGSGINKVEDAEF